MQNLRLVHVELKAANAFVRKYHRHHDEVQGHRFSIGAVLHRQLVGVAIIGRPVGGQHPQDWAEVTRLCTDGTKNASSFLYAASARAAFALGFYRIQTYILDRETGLTLRAAGWQFDRMSHPVGWHHDGPRPARNVPKHLSGPKKLWYKALAFSAPPYDNPAVARAEKRPSFSGLFTEAREQ